MKEWSCHRCGSPGKNDPADELYCSGKCRALDGVEPLPQSVISEEMKMTRTPASLADYKKNHKDYRRRYEPERLNWGEPLDAPALKQAGFRANRKPIPGDWDYDGTEKTDTQEPK